MTPTASALYKCAGQNIKLILSEAQYFSPSQKLLSDCRIIAENDCRGLNSDDIVFFASPMPAHNVVIDCGINGEFYIQKDKTNDHDRFISVISNSRIEPLVGIIDNVLRRYDITNSLYFISDSEVLILAHFIDVLLNIIAEPRLIVKTAPLRAHRKRAARLLGAVPLPAWHSVSWIVGGATKPKRDSGRENWRAPLHFSRAHWRRSAGTEPKAQTRDGKPGYWILVASSWKGHPDYGVKLHHYRPRANGERASATSAAPMPPATAAATQAAHDAAIQAWTRHNAAKGAGAAFIGAR